MIPPAVELCRKMLRQSAEFIQANRGRQHVCGNSGKIRQVEERTPRIPQMRGASCDHSESVKFGRAKAKSPKSQAPAPGHHLASSPSCGYGQLGNPPIARINSTTKRMISIEDLSGSIEPLGGVSTA